MDAMPDVPAKKKDKATRKKEREARERALRARLPAWAGPHWFGLGQARACALPPARCACACMSTCTCTRHAQKQKMRTQHCTHCMAAAVLTAPILI